MASQCVVHTGSRRFSVVLVGSQCSRRFSMVLSCYRRFSVLLVGSHGFSVFSWVLSGSQ